jgi:hypothetical protein
VDSLWILLVGNEWVNEWTLLRNTRHKRGPLVIWIDTFGETSASTIKTGEAIEKPCSDLLASHQRKCDCAWPAWRNGDVSHLETGDEITTHGECVQPL